MGNAASEATFRTAVRRTRMRSLLTGLAIAAAHNCGIRNYDVDLAYDAARARVAADATLRLDVWIARELDLSRTQTATLIANGRGSLLRQAREKSRRNRDLSVIGGGLWYGLSVLDAYVNAHLIDFDTDERLSVRLSPHPEGFSVRLTYSLP